MLHKKDAIIKIEQLTALIEYLRKRRESAPIDKEEIQRLLKEIEERVLSLSEEAERIEKAKIAELARKRSIVLAITALIEIGVAFAIAPFEKTIAKFAAIYVFAPLVSAVSGNYGLQTASIVIRAMAIGTLKDKTKTILREVGVGILCGLVIGVFVGSIAAITTKEIIAFPVIVCAMTAAMLTSGFMGAIFPQITKMLGFDPAIVAGPAETAVQDLVGYTTFLAILTILSKYF